MNRVSTKGLHLLVDEQRAEAAEWRRFSASHSAAARTALFERYREIARRSARYECKKIEGRGLDLCDCEQLAFEALLHCIERFEPSRGASFPAFAGQRIRGAILNALPKASESSAAYNARKRAERDRLASLKRGATTSGNVDPIEGLRHVVIGMALGFLLEDNASLEAERVPSEDPSAYDSVAWQQIVQAMESKLSALPDQERAVLEYHYKQGLRFAEIATLLGLSRGRISQIHSKALAHLRSSLAKFR